MNTQSKKQSASTPEIKDSNHVTAKLNTTLRTSGLPGGIITREKTRHLNLMANTNIFGFQRGPYVILPTRVAPAKLIENRPAWVEFELWNRAGTLLTDAFVRARITAHQSVDDYEGSFNFPIKNLDVGQSIQGAISFVLPRAAVGNVVTLELCQYGPLVAEIAPLNILTADQIEFDVAARFTISMTGIWIRDTASHHEDTLVVSFNAHTGDNSWGDVSHLGDHNNTSRAGILPEVMPVGPFDMLPGSGSNVAVSCIIANAGHTSTEEDAKKALTIVSKVGEVTAATVLSIMFPFGAALWTSLASATNELHLAIINYAFANCDTVVLRDSRFITEQDLFNYTNDPYDQKSEAFPVEWIMRCQKKVGKLPKLTEDEPELPLGNGCRDSDYTTGLFVKRLRLPEMFHNYNIDGTHLSPGQKTTFAPLGHFSADKIIYDWEGKAPVSPTGIFKAPATITDRKFEIIKWTILEENKNGIFPAFEDFAIVILD